MTTSGFVFLIPIGYRSLAQDLYPNKGALITLKYNTLQITLSRNLTANQLLQDDRLFKVLTFYGNLMLH